MKTVTLRDIAKKLGVSIGTVDRAIHNRPDVSPSTRRRVLELIEKYDYKPDAAARALSLRANPRKIGVILNDHPSYNYFWDQMALGVQTAASQLNGSGIEVLIRRIQDESLSVLSTVDEFIGAKVDAVAFVPRENEQVRRAVEHLEGASLPFITMNDDIEHSTRLCYVGPHSLQSGRVAGELMGRFVRGKGRVVLIRNGIKSLDYETRAVGFMEKIREDFPHVSLALTITLAGSEEVEADPERAFSLCEELFRLTQIDGIYDATSRLLPFLGKLKAEKEALQTTVIIGHELNDQTRACLLNGTVAATLSQDPFSQGYTVVRTLADYLQEKKLPEFDKLYSRTDIILKENLIANGQDTLRHVHLL